MKRLFRFILWSWAFSVMCPQFLISQDTHNGYVQFDSYGKKVYLIPDQIAKRTMDSTLNFQTASEPPVTIVNKNEYYYGVQVGSFAVIENANNLKRKLDEDGFQVFIWQWYSRQNNKVLHVVSIGNCATTEEAFSILKTIKTSYQLDGFMTSSQLQRSQSQASSLLK